VTLPSVAAPTLRIFAAALASRASAAPPRLVRALVHPLSLACLLAPCPLPSAIAPAYRLPPAVAARLSTDAAPSPPRPCPASTFRSARSLSPAFSSVLPLRASVDVAPPAA